MAGTMETRSDVAVVGAGLLGLATARALARRGNEVILLEQAEIGHEASGSKGSCRIFRLGYDDAEWVNMAIRARGAWAELEDDCGRQLLAPTPHLTFGQELDAVRDAMRAAGAPHEQLTEAEVAARFPGIAIGGPALLELESCVISADGALQALAAAVPDIRAGVTVTGIADDGRRVTVRTTAGQVSARAAVVCAGPWTSALLAGSGIAVPSEATMEQVGYLGLARQLAQHVAEGTEDDVGAARDGVRLVDHFERRDADRTAGAVDQLDIPRQQVVDAVFDDGVGLAAADFHDDPGLRLHPLDALDQFGGDVAVAILIEVFHETPPERSLTSGMSSSPS